MSRSLCSHVVAGSFSYWVSSIVRKATETEAEKAENIGDRIIPQKIIMVTEGKHIVKAWPDTMKLGDRFDSKYLAVGVLSMDGETLIKPGDYHVAFSGEVKATMTVRFSASADVDGGPNNDLVFTSQPTKADSKGLFYFTSAFTAKPQFGPGYLNINVFARPGKTA